jgi:hypothetical protein
VSITDGIAQDRRTVPARHRKPVPNSRRPGPHTRSLGLGYRGPGPDTGVFTGRSVRAAPAAGAAPATGAARFPWVWQLLGIWTAVWAAAHVTAYGYSWHYFAEGSGLLFGGGSGGGLDLYATHPQLQIGPVTLAAAAPIAALGPRAGRIAAVLVMTAAGPLLLNAIWKLLPARARSSPWPLLGAGLIFLPVWTELGTHYGHLDDVLALVFGVAAMHAVARRRPVLAALLLAAATDAKPWAAGFAAMLLALPRPTWRRSLPVFIGGVVFAWLPFAAADPHTLAVTGFTIPNSGASALRALGVSAARTPSWDRPAQLALGALLAALAVRRGRWPATILLVTGARIVLDPSVYPYYTSGLLVGAVAYDLLAARHRWPWTTLAGAVTLYVAHCAGYLHILSPHALGVLRAIFTIGMALVVLAWPRTDEPGERVRLVRAMRLGMRGPATGPVSGGESRAAPGYPALPATPLGSAVHTPHLPGRPLDPHGAPGGWRYPRRTSGDWRRELLARPPAAAGSAHWAKIERAS